MEIINSLAYLQEHNIVHRDIKPQNMLLDDTFHIKLADFGTAKIVDPLAVVEELDDPDLQDDTESNSSVSDSGEFDVSLLLLRYR